MGCFSGPKVESSQLVAAFDAANSKGFDAYENLFERSEQFDHAYWTITNLNGTITANQTAAPDGTTTADLYQEDATNNIRYITKGMPVISGTSYTLSIWAKQAPGSTRYLGLIFPLSGFGANVSISFTLSGAGSYTLVTSGTATSAGIQEYPNGWYRCYLTSQATTTSTPIPQIRLSNSSAFGGPTYQGDGTSGLYIWGVQFETGSSLSSYYATTTTVKIRGSTLIDMSGRGNTGTLTNGPTYSSANGGSIVFDGVDDYVSIPNALSSISGSNSHTFSFWFNASNLSTDKIPFSSGLAGNYYIQLTSSVFYVQIGSSYRTYSLSTSTNTWYNVCFVKNGINDAGDLYINSSLKSSYTGSITSTPSGLSSLFLGRYFGAGYVFPGNISQASIYNRALSASEVSQNFNAIRGRFGI